MRNQRIPEVHVVRYGSFISGPTESIARCTVSLVKSKKNILVDTGGSWESDEILASLRKLEIEPTQIDIVICTHGHSDHIGNLNLFSESIQILGDDMNKRDAYKSVPFDKDGVFFLEDFIKLMKTPGHSFDDASVLIDQGILHWSNTQATGKIAIVGDLYDQENDEDSFKSTSSDPDLQTKYRHLIRNQYDLIVPGHGPPFETHRIRI